MTCGDVTVPHPDFLALKGPLMQCSSKNCVWIGRRDEARKLQGRTVCPWCGRLVKKYSGPKDFPLGGK